MLTPVPKPKTESKKYPTESKCYKMQHMEWILMYLVLIVE